MVGAGLLLVAAAGCMNGSFLASWPGPGGKQQIVSGSVDQVSAKLRASLGNVGINVTATPDGDNLRLSGVTKSGKKFSLLLKKQYAGGGERTAVTIDWEGEADEEFWLTLVQWVTPPPPAWKNVFSGNSTDTQPAPAAGQK
jgi:hypothetical protein